MIRIKETCEKAKAAFVAIIHLNKQSQLSSVQRMLGAASMAGVCRGSWEFSIDKDDKKLRRMAFGKGNLGPNTKGLYYRIVGAPVDMEDGKPPADIGKVEWGEPLEQSADEVAASDKAKAGRPETPEVAKVREFVMSRLAGG